MTRRTILTAAELTMSAAALASAVAVLAQAAYQPGSVQWTPIAMVGVVTALAFVGFAALLFAGRAGLMLGADAVTALRRRRAVREAREHIAAQAGYGHHRADLPPTLRYTAEELAAAGGKPVGHG